MPSSHYLNLRCFHARVYGQRTVPFTVKIDVDDARATVDVFNARPQCYLIKLNARDRQLALYFRSPLLAGLQPHKLHGRR